MSTGNVVGGTAWYRKHFNISKADAGKTAYLQFDGVYMNSDVWVNGKHLGHYPYGYTSFYYDITPYLNPVGQSNVVAVEVKNEGLNTRWYSGSGIYRHTWLTMVNPVHIAPWGVYVSSPNISAQKASVEVVTTVSNVEKKNLKVNYVVKILNPNGLVVGKANIQGQVRAGQTTDLKQILTVNNPMLWSIENPKLYHTEVEVLINGKTLQCTTQLQQPLPLRVLP